MDHTIEVPGLPKTRLPVVALPNVKFVLLLVMGLRIVRVLLSADMKVPVPGSSLKLIAPIPNALSFPIATVTLLLFGLAPMVVPTV